MAGNLLIKEEPEQIVTEDGKIYLMKVFSKTDDSVSFQEQSNAKFTFIDLFAGIGGFHQALNNLGRKCVFASEIDKYAIETYKNNYKINSNINIRDIKVENIPKHDVLCAGFPCQAFSKAGNQMGFDDETRGTLFFEIVRILK